MQGPRISIIIPAYNAEKWIGDAIRSALAQTWAEKEIIVVDDGSTDRTLDVAKGFESQAVKIFSKQNGGASSARNLGLREARGDFIQYLDADDLLSPTKIEDQVSLLCSSKEGAVAISGTVHFFDGSDPDGGILTDDWPMVDSDDPFNWLIDLLGPDHPGGMVHPGAWLVPRSITAAAGPWDESLTLDDDGEYFARVVLASTGLRRSRPGVSYYRKFRHGLNLSGSKSEAHHRSALRATELVGEQILSRKRDARAMKALSRRYMSCAIMAYPDHPVVSKASLKKAKEMGGVAQLPTIGGWRLKLIQRLFGWKVARRVSSLYQGYLGS